MKKEQNAQTRKPKTKDKAKQVAASACQDISGNPDHVKNLAALDRAYEFDQIWIGQTFLTSRNGLGKENNDRKDWVGGLLCSCQL